MTKLLIILLQTYHIHSSKEDLCYHQEGQDEFLRFKEAHLGQQERITLNSDHKWGTKKPIDFHTLLS